MTRATFFFTKHPKASTSQPPIRGTKRGNRSYFAIVLTISVIYLPSVFAADVTSGFVMERTWSRAANYSNDSVTGFRAGLSVDVPGLNMEGSYADLGRFVRKPAGDSATELKTFSLIGSKPFPLGQSLTIAPMVGVNQWQVQTKTAGVVTGKDKGLSVLYGVQLADQYFPYLSVRMSYIRNENIANTRINILSLGAELSY